MARACELALLAAVAVLLASTATAFTTPSCIKEAQQLVKVLDAKPQFYSDISTELKKLIKAVSKIKNNEKLYRIHIFDGQLDSMAVGDVQMTTQPGVSVKVFKARPSASPMKMAVRLVKSKKPPVPVLAHLHTGTGNCFEAYGIGGVLS
ncbi:unnamed protein product [Closterium sp. Naga37s-1]|nr:unnamed protein product [Closterium sp. Naga37s-1]